MAFFFLTACSQKFEITLLIQISLFENLHLGTRTIAVVNGPESRETLESSFKEIFDGDHGIIKTGYITVDSKQVDIEMFLGGDYKVIK